MPRSGCGSPTECVYTFSCKKRSARDECPKQGDEGRWRGGQTIKRKVRFFTVLCRDCLLMAHGSTNTQRVDFALPTDTGKPDLNTGLPIRQTASIFKQPITKVVNHPNNKVKTDLQRATEQPRQLFWEKRLKGLRASDITEEVLRTMELPKGLTSLGPDTSDETLLSAISSALHMSSSPITGQTNSAAEKNPAVWLNTSQPLCKAFIVTDQDIR
uniref:Methyl-CpG binding domain protein 2 n=1 Tax=Hucho hucho TaxID=62062 RepID=A0A4W5PN31_9TELE